MCKYLLFLCFALVSCTPKTAQQLSAPATPTFNLEDGFYVVTNSGYNPKELLPIKQTETIITFNKDFIDPNDVSHLTIDASDFVPLSLKEKPTSEIQADKSQNFYLALNDDAKVKLEQFTRVNLYKTSAIVVNGEAYTKHKIKSVIEGGYLQITQCSENACRILYDQFDDNVVGLPSDKDWANLQRFHKQNKELKMSEKNKNTNISTNNRVVFMGNSITEGWLNSPLTFFDNPDYINRGISGQTTPQMLVRFRPDVIDLKPKVVVILAGINDIAGNTGPMTLEAISNNIFSMAELAQANDIKVVLSSVLPAYDFPWNPGLGPAEKVIQLNKMIQEYAAANDCIYLDYFSAMADDRNGLPKELSEDEVHPTVAGYRIMEPLVEGAILEALAE